MGRKAKNLSGQKFGMLTAQYATEKNVLNISEKMNLKCYMQGGTMLGAIRHGGFIPWDDDVDLGMMRDDYLQVL